MHDTEAAIKALGQAYIGHRWCRDLKVRLGKEQDLFQGLARCLLDTFSADPVLLLPQPEPSSGAAVVLSGEQEAEFVAALQGLQLGVIPGTLQIMQAIPEGRLPQLTGMLRELQEGSGAAARAAGHDSFLKLVCLGVRPDAQGRGVGGQLLGAAAALAAQRRRPLYADAGDDDVVAMLERRGFRPVGRAAGSHMVQLVLQPL